MKNARCHAPAQPISDAEIDAAISATFADMQARRAMLAALAEEPSPALPEHRRCFRRIMSEQLGFQIRSQGTPVSRLIVGQLKQQMATAVRSGTVARRRCSLDRRSHNHPA